MALNPTSDSVLVGISHNYSADLPDGVPSPAQLAGGGATSGKPSPMVFMGTTPGKLPSDAGIFDQYNSVPKDLRAPKRPFDGTIGGSLRLTDGLGNVVHKPTKGTSPTSHVLDLDAAVNAPLTWKRKAQMSAIERANRLGYKVDTFADFLQVWEDASKAAASAYQNGSGKKISPWDMMEILASSPSGPGGPQKPAGPPPFTGTKTYTSTNRSIDDIDPDTANAALTGVLSQLLGRDPTTAEKADYLSKATGYSKLNPTITQTTTNAQYVDGHPTGNDTSSSERSGGATTAGLQSIAEDQAKQNPEYGAYQAAGTVYNWLTSALGSAA